MTRGHPRLDQAFTHCCSSRRIFTRRTVEDSCHAIEAANLLFAGQRRVIGDIVSDPGEPVKGVHMRSQFAADQEGANRKILCAAPFARRRLDATDSLVPQLGRLSCHWRYPFALNQPMASAIAWRAGRGV